MLLVSEKFLTVSTQDNCIAGGNTSFSGPPDTVLQKNRFVMNFQKSRTDTFQSLILSGYNTETNLICKFRKELKKMCAFF